MEQVALQDGSPGRLFLISSNMGRSLSLPESERTIVIRCSHYDDSKVRKMNIEKHFCFIY